MIAVYDDARYETDSGIATIAIDRLDVLNAFPEWTISKLNDALRAADEDDGVYVLVLAGALRNVGTDPTYCLDGDHRVELGHSAAAVLLGEVSSEKVLLSEEFNVLSRWIAPPAERCVGEHTLGEVFER